MEIILAIILGTFFGFVLQRIGAADPDKIIGMLRLTDLHLVKTILTGIGVSSSLLFLGLLVGIIDPGHLSVKPMYTGVLIGGILLGIGWAISGFCPGTGIVAAGSGRKDALFYILGGMVGAGIFTVMYKYLAETLLFITLFGGKVTLAETGKYDALVRGINGSLLAIMIGLAFVIVCLKLPRYLRKLQ